MNLICAAYRLSAPDLSVIDRSQFKAPSNWTDKAKIDAEIEKKYRAACEAVAAGVPYLSKVSDLRLARWNGAGFVDLTPLGKPEDPDGGPWYAGVLKEAMMNAPAERTRVFAFDAKRLIKTAAAECAMRSDPMPPEYWYGSGAGYIDAEAAALPGDFPGLSWPIVYAALQLQNTAVEGSEIDSEIRRLCGLAAQLGFARASAA